MMGALRAGGMLVPAKPFGCRHPPDVVARNPKGYFEGGLREELIPDALYKAFFEVLVKRTEPGKVAVMWRDETAIANSFRKSFNRRDIAIWAGNKYRLDMVEKLKQRGGLDIIIINFEDVIADPLKAFMQLRDFGFPIKDLDAAVAWVDPKLKHF